MYTARLKGKFTWAYGLLWTRYLTSAVFVHINKTAGSSVEAALRMPFQHRTARELRDLMGSRFERAFVFSFVRNPWDKVASHYWYRVKTNQTGLGDRHLGFNEWVMRAYGERDPRYYDHPRMFMPQLDWLTDEHGRIIVDYVGRFERLRKDFREVASRIGVDRQLPHQKASGKPRYQELYDTKSKALIAERFAPDIECFGYRF